MLKKALVSSFLLVALCNWLDCNSRGQGLEREIKVVGQVIAYDDFINIKGAPQSQCLIVKVAKRLEGDEQSEYIKVAYGALHGQGGLPKEMESSKSLWVFTLKRAADDNEACKEPVKAWIRTRPETGFKLPDPEKLTCYLLDPSGFKPYDKTH